MVKVNPKRYLAYLLRWQASTPILAGVGILLAGMGQIIAAIVANLIGGLIFFWVDMFIFTTPVLSTQWDVRDNILCADCGKTARGYRIVKTENYDKFNDPEPEFRCEECSRKKAEELRRRGVRID